MITLPDAVTASQEAKGRTKFQNKYKKQYEKNHLIFTEGKYNPVDFYMTGGTVTYVGDIKDVNREYSKFTFQGKDYGYMIDFNKLEGIKEEAAKDNRRPILVVYFLDCFVVWNLSNIDYESRKRIKQCTDVSSGGHYKEVMRDKVETYLYKNEAAYVEEYDKPRNS